MAELLDSDPRKVKDWTIRARIGSGGTGVVYDGVNSQGQRAAIKVLRPDLADNQSVRARLRREAELLMRVSGGRTAAVYEVDADHTPPFIAMEFVSGVTLAEFVEKNGPIRGALAWSLVDAAIQALAAIHAAGIIHRDLKPSNILLGEDGVKVVDFGISVLQEASTSTHTGALVGTVAWLSPEQITGEKISEASDVFNLGMVLAYALSGSHPFGLGRPDAVMFRVAHGEPNLTGISHNFVPFITSCLEKDPKQRPTLNSLKSLLGKIDTSDSSQPSSTNATGTIVVDRTYLEQEAVNASLRSHVDSKNSEETSGFEVNKDKKILAGIAVALAVLAGVIITANNRDSSSTDFASTTSVVEVPDTVTPTTIGGPPKFTVEEFEGKGLRFDPCDGIVTVAINYGGLGSTRSAIATEIVQEAIQFLSEQTGIDFVFSGATDALPSREWRKGRNGSRTITLGLLEPGESGVGMIKKGEQFGSQTQTFLGSDASGSDWHAIESFDAQIVPSLFPDTASLKIRIRQVLLRSIGLNYVVEPISVTTSNELLAVHDSDGTATFLSKSAEWGPGDILGMSAVGKQNGCIG